MSINKLELRIGNLLELSNPKFRPEEDGKIIRINELREDNALVSLLDTTVLDTSFGQLYKFLKPIPLDSSVLQKCGLELHSETEFLKVFIHPNKWHISLWVTDEKVAGFEEKNVAYWGDEYLPVKYLHTLQNLFYATTNGTELQITL